MHQIGLSCSDKQVVQPLLPQPDAPGIAATQQVHQAGPVSRELWLGPWPARRLLPCFLLQGRQPAVKRKALAWSVRFGGTEGALYGKTFLFVHTSGVCA